MSTTAGVFDETTLYAIQARADELLLDDRIKQQFIPNYDVLKAISAVQTANINPLVAGKDKEVDVIWQNVCGTTVESDSACTFDCNKSSTNKETLSLTYEKKVDFCEDESDYIDNAFNLQDAVAKQLLSAEKNLIEDFAQYAVSVINANKGVNAATGKGTVSGADTYVPATMWDYTLMAYFAKCGVVNKFTNPVILSGQNLFESSLVAGYNMASQAGAANKAFGTFPTYFDLFNIDTINDPDFVTYLLSMGSLAMASKTYNPANPEIVPNVFTRYSMPSKFVPGLNFDVWTKAECSLRNMVKYSFKVRLTADVFANPAGCTSTNTGILSFICGVPSLQ